MIRHWWEYQLQNPWQLVAGGISLTAIVVGLGVGVAKGNFNPKASQLQLETQKESQMLAEKMFQAGCEGVFYLNEQQNVYQPLTEGQGVLSGAYWVRYKKAPKGQKPQPALTDYLPAGTIVCDSYGNIGPLVKSDNAAHAVVGTLVNTPNPEIIRNMMKRYPGAKRPQVGV